MALSVVTVVYIGMKWALFDTESTTVMIVLYLEDLESSTTKSTLRVFYLASGMGSGYSSPIRGCLAIFIWRHRSQVLIYYLAYLDI